MKTRFACRVCDIRGSNDWNQADEKLADDILARNHEREDIRHAPREESSALEGSAPRFFIRCIQSGIPYWSLAASMTSSILAYLNVASMDAKGFNWFINIINTGGYQSWICCCMLYILFRNATISQWVTDYGLAPAI